MTTARNVKDRIVQYPGRFKMVEVSGQPGVFDFEPVPGDIIEEGTDINKAYLQPLEDISFQTYKRSIYNDKISKACYYSLIIDGKITDETNKVNGFFEDGVHDFKDNPLSCGYIDKTKGNIESISPGNFVNVKNMLSGVFSDFKEKQEITIDNGVNMEDLTILDSDNIDKLTFTTPIQKEYEGNVNIYRSNVKIDNGIKIGAISSSNTFDWSVVNYEWILADLYDKYIGGGIIDGVLYGAFQKKGIGIRVLKYDGVESEVFRIDNIDLKSNFGCFGYDSYGNIIITASSGSYTYIWRVDPNKTSGDVWSSRLSVFTAQITINEVQLIIDESDNIAVGIVSVSSNPDNISLVWCRYGVVLENGFSWSANGEQVVNSNIVYPIGSLSIAFYNGVVMISFALPNAYGDTKSGYIAIRNATLTSQSFLNSNWTGKSTLTGLFIETHGLYFKNKGSNLNRMLNLINSGLGGNLYVRYSDNGGISQSSILISSNAYEPDLTIKENGDIEVAYQKIEDSISVDYNNQPNIDIQLPNGTSKGMTFRCDSGFDIKAIDFTTIFSAPANSKFVIHLRKASSFTDYNGEILDTTYFSKNSIANNSFMKAGFRNIELDDNDIVCVTVHNISGFTTELSGTTTVSPHGKVEGTSYYTIFEATYKNYSCVKKILLDGQTSFGSEIQIKDYSVNPKYLKNQNEYVLEDKYSLNYKKNNSYFQTGKILIGTSIEVLKTVIRTNIIPPEIATAITAYLTHNGITGVKIDASSSIVMNGENEVYEELTDTEFDVEVGKEIVSAGLPSTPGDEATLKYNITRDSIDDDVVIIQIYGGIV